jgi:hypothetical protein
VKALWLAINEGYIEVARLKRKEANRPALLEVRAEHLKDYLCARGMALYISSYRRHMETCEDAGHIHWVENPLREISGGERWEGRVTDIHEGGSFFGSSWHVARIGREGIFAEDVPTIGPFDESIITSKSLKVTEQGRKLVRIQGEFWRNEWVLPSAI